jgi:hypothetical protein
MRPWFLRPGEKTPPHSLVVDCAVEGNAVYSHWQGAAPTPPSLLADTSTEIVLKAAENPGQWLSDFSYVVNDHLDADGLLAMAVACHPQFALSHRDLLIAAAEAGDFSVWTTEAGFRLMLVLHQHVQTFATSGEGWEQRLCDYCIDHFPALIASAALSDPQRDAQVARVQATMAALQRQQGFHIARTPRLIAVLWQQVHGHTDSFRVVERADDLPEWALSTVCSAHQFQLLAMKTSTGIIYQLDAPRHSWARTVQRPTIAWPDCTALAQHLQQRESATCQWVTLPISRSNGFVCLLASVDNHGLTASSLAFDDVWQALDQTLQASAEHA